MNISERIKLLRKDLNKNQAEFAASLGLRQSTVGNYESGSRSISNATILAICREWQVDEDWLRYGTGGEGPIYMKSNTFSLDEFAKQHGATELELNILKAYFELDPALRNDLVQHFKERLTISRATAVNIVPQSVSNTNDLDIENEVTEYRQELFLEKKAAERSAVSGTINAKEA
ncbi:MAG: helix-turn-helix domain-containing protein [Lachnospiraceae bacterium]|nr:helix-turn-helix domain-containing protein [Lachnospiraceae bacterium]